MKLPIFSKYAGFTNSVTDALIVQLFLIDGHIWRQNMQANQSTTQNALSDRKLPRVQLPSNI